MYACLPVSSPCLDCLAAFRLCVLNARNRELPMAVLYLALDDASGILNEDERPRVRNFGQDGIWIALRTIAVDGCCGHVRCSWQVQNLYASTCIH